MKTIQIYKVYPAIPEPLRFLGDLARNLWWCWNDDAIDLFRRIRPEQWEKWGKIRWFFWPIFLSTGMKSFPGMKAFWGTWRG